jgi:rhodanese-related sulfurtransferase
MFMKNKSFPRRALLAAVCAALLICALLSGCGDVTDGDGTERTVEYTKITAEEAMKMIEEDDSLVIVDVRRLDEFTEGHIPDAICIPNETIENEPPKELPDPDQVILIYCRSGNRSKQAAQKLAAMGYTNIYEFGGIIDWPGDIVRETVTG